jgi:hypothetical protein
MRRSAAYFIEGKEVAQKEFDARLKSVKEIEQTWFCAETPDGGINGYDGKDANGVVYEFRNTVDQKASRSSLEKKPAPRAP